MDKGGGLWRIILFGSKVNIAIGFANETFEFEKECFQRYGSQATIEPRKTSKTSLKRQNMKINDSSLVVSELILV